jgi:multiple sugar transport system substrate-binding protein
MLKKRKGIMILLVLGLIFTAGMMTVEAKKAKVTLNVWCPTENATNDKYWTDAMKEYEKKNQNVKIKLTMIPQAASDQETKLTVAKLSNTYPDIFISYLIFLGSRGSKGDFMDLTKYFNSWKEKDDLMPNVVEMGKVKGKLLGLGFYPAPIVFVYRKDMFREAGLDPEKPPKTWEKIEEYAKKLAKYDSNGKLIRSGIDIPVYTPDKHFKIFMWSNGGFNTFIDEKKNVPNFNSPAAIEAVDFIARLFKENLIIPYDEAKTQEQPFVKGVGAMGWVNPYIAKQMYDNPKYKGKIGFGTVLERKYKANFCGFRFFTMGKSSKHKAASWALIKFLMSKQQFEKRINDAAIPPVRLSMVKEFVSKDPLFNQTLMEAIKYGKGNEPVPWIQLAHKHFYVAYEEAISGKKPTKQALNDAYNKLMVDLKSFKQ